MRRGIWIVTGIAGTGVKPSMQKIQARFPRLKSISLEDAFFRKLAQPYIEQQVPRDGTLVVERDNHIMNVLKLPRFLLQILWKQAVSMALAELAKLENQDIPVLLLHASYYHLPTKQHLAILDPTTLKTEIDKAGFQCHGVISFIDDIFDCQQRLCSADPRIMDPPNSLVDSLLGLFRILDWRHQEILVSRLLASQLDDHIVHSVIAVKHPLDMFWDVMGERKKLLYLSHHISEPRRAFGEGNIEIIDNFLRVYRESTNKLRRYYAVFEPTTIDEYRFQDMPISPKPKLTTRWPLLKDQIPRTDDIAWTQPPRCFSQYAFPSGWDDDTREFTTEEMSECARLLDQLSLTIDRHVTGRDYQLMDQSEITYGFRPLFNGNAARGVHTELSYVCECKEFGSPKYAVVFCPTSDREMFAGRTIWDPKFKEWKSENVLQGSDQQFAVFEEALRQRDDDLRKFVLAQKVKDLASLLRGLIEASGLQFRREAQHVRPMEPDRMAIRQEECERIAADAIKTGSQPYLDSLDVEAHTENPRLPFTFPQQAKLPFEPE